MDGAGAGTGWCWKLQACVHGAVEGVLGWGVAGSQCSAGQCVWKCGWGGRWLLAWEALRSGMVSDPAGLELDTHSLVQPAGIEGTPALHQGQPGGERAPSL